MPVQLNELRDRFERAGYSAQIGEDITYRDEPSTPAVLVSLKEYDSYFHTSIPEGPTADAVAESQFDQFQLLPDYEAVWQPIDGIVECAIEGGTPFRLGYDALAAVARELGLLDDSNAGRRRVVEIEVPSPADGVRVRFTTASNEFIILRQLLRPRGSLRYRIERSSRYMEPVIRLEVVPAGSPREAADYLERIGNSVNLQIDLKTQIPIVLARRRDEIWRQRPSEREPQRAAADPLTAPQFQYDPEPMALYWYGRTAFGFPLLRFLACYQVIEYYFPHFAFSRAQAELRRRLKDPRFNVENDSHIADLVSVTTQSVGGRGFGNEEEQLHETIHSCVSPEQMRNFFESNDRIKRFYERNDKRPMPIVPISIPISSSSADLRSSVTKRLYAIRCRIVHSKSTRGEEILLPFSREASLLTFDTELIQFIARQVLIDRSRPF